MSDMMRDVYYVLNVTKNDLEFITTDQRKAYEYKALKSYSMDRYEVGKGIVLTGDLAYYFSMGAF